ncbi:MAG: FTR1 family protein [Alicyclobacillus sp.]|nr:FTR1 family protein [Alicyclobacillus sp.]
MTFGRRTRRWMALVLCMVVAGVLAWQGITANGAPDPTAHNLTPTAAVIDTGVLVFREGLETILVLSAITASLVRTQTSYWRPIASGAGLAFAATLVTWFVVVGMIALVGSTTSELNIQAATGLLAIIVLLIVMNWFFHKIYWTGWISFHNRKKRELIEAAEAASNLADPVAADSAKALAYKGLVVLGFFSVYREGFEVVLFLQTIRMQVGSLTVLIGTLIGLGLTLVVAYLTFLAHQHLPYKKMLIFTGVMLGVVLLVMVGEQVNEMQLAGWISTTTLPMSFPAWLGVWFSVFNNVESLVAQGLAALLVLGSYFFSQYTKVWRPRRQARRALQQATFNG